MWTNDHGNKANLDLKERKNKTERVQKTKNITLTSRHGV